MVDLQTQVDELRRQLDALRHSVEGDARRRRWPILALTGAFLLGGLVLGPIWQSRSAHAAQDEKEAKALVCSSLTVMNREGRKIVALDGDVDGGLVRIYGQDGRERAFVGVNVKAGGGLIMLGDPSGAVRSVWEVNQTGRPSMRFNNSFGRPDVVLGSSPNHWGGMLHLNGPNGAPAATMEVDENNAGRLKFYDRLDKLMFFAGIDDKGGFVRLSDHDGKDFFRVGAEDKTGAFLDLYDGTRNPTRLNVPALENLTRRIRELAP